MRKLLNKPWFVALLAIAALLVVGREFLPGGKKPAAPVPGIEAAEDGQSVGDDGESGPRLPVTEALKAISRPVDGRDPFALPPKPAAPDSEVATGTAAAETSHHLRVSAVWLQGEATLVLANGRICTPGESVGDFTIESAAIDGAWINHPGGRAFVPVGTDFVLKTTKPNVPAPTSK